MKKSLTPARQLRNLHYLTTNQSDHHNDNAEIQRRGLITAKLSNEMQRSSPQNNGSTAMLFRNNPNIAAIIVRLYVCLHIYVS